MTTNTSCLCTLPNVWNVAGQTCACSSLQITLYNKTCVTCAALSQFATEQLDPFNCKCANKNLFWDNIKLTCVDCTKLQNGLSKSTELTCNCAKGYIFDVLTNTCILPCNQAGINIQKCLNCSALASINTASTTTIAYTGNLTLSNGSLINSQYSFLKNTLKKYS
jgi:hypothetical protein